MVRQVAALMPFRAEFEHDQTRRTYPWLGYNFGNRGECEILLETTQVDRFWREKINSHCCFFNHHPAQCPTKDGEQMALALRD